VMQCQLSHGDRLVSHGDRLAHVFLEATNSAIGQYPPDLIADRRQKRGGVGELGTIKQASKMLNPDAHIKSMSTFEMDEHLQRGRRTFG